MSCGSSYEHIPHCIRVFGIMLHHVECHQDVGLITFILYGMGYPRGEYETKDLSFRDFKIFHHITITHANQGRSRYNNGLCAFLMILKYILF